MRVSDFNYTSARSLWLPQYAATYSPAKNLTLYGNYGQTLSLGPQAPWWVDNANVFLDPFFTRQAEAGVKYEKQVLLTAAVFRMRQPFFYPRVVSGPDNFCSGAGAGDLCFEAMGHETHDGLELNAQGKVASSDTTSPLILASTNCVSILRKPSMAMTIRKVVANPAGCLM